MEELPPVVVVPVLLVAAVVRVLAAAVEVGTASRVKNYSPHGGNLSITKKLLIA